MSAIRDALKANDTQYKAAVKLYNKKEDGNVMKKPSENSALSSIEERLNS